ncbi:MAG TPA: hypothetical protein VH277_08575, partial [Gemmatimonadaceae bacterium]|nr:hypothetical protein [Gemmatimonadaceae bacterium]
MAVTSAGLAPQMSQHVPGSDQMVVEDLARDGQEVGQERIPEIVPDAHAFFSGADDVARPQHAELLRNDGLAET